MSPLLFQCIHREHNERSERGTEQQWIRLTIGWRNEHCYRQHKLWMITEFSKSGRNVYHKWARFFQNKQRLAMAVQALNNMQYMWKSASKELKLKVLRTCIFPIATYGCETWVLRKLDIKRINAFEMKCYRKILRIPWIAHRTNCSILSELHLPTNRLYKFVRRQKLKYFGHVTRHDGLEKTIMQGMVAGKRSRGKPRQRLEKDITDTFGTMIAASRVAEDWHRLRRDIWAARSWRGYAPRRRINVGTSFITCAVDTYTFSLTD